MTLESTEVDEQVWKVSVALAYPGGGPAFESYRQGLFNNRLWLQKADGSRFEHNGGFNNTGADGGKLGFEYLFVDAPGKPADYGLVYETPGKSSRSRSNSSSRMCRCLDESFRLSAVSFFGDAVDSERRDRSRSPHPDLSG